MTPRCDDCGGTEQQRGELNIVSADLGNGAFLAVLCSACWHRRQYRAELEKRRAAARRAHDMQKPPTELGASGPP